MAAKTVTVKSSGGDYPSLNAALSGESADLVTNTRLLTIETYAFEDTTDANTGTGYTVSADYYIKITSPESERHAGVWSTSKSRHKTTYSGTNTGADSAGATLRVQTDYTIVEFQQIDVAPSADGSGETDGVIVYDSANVTVKHCLVRKSGSYRQSSAMYGIYFCITSADRSGCVCDRNIIYDIGIFFYAVSVNFVSALIYNNTIFNAEWEGLYLYDTDTGSTITVKNNYSGDCDTDFYSGGCTITSSKNITSDATSPDGASYQGKTAYSDYFVDYTNRDFHLKSTDTVLKDAGDDLGSPYNIDIDGETVSGTWDIGADEYVSGAAVVVPIFIRQYRARRI